MTATDELRRLLDDRGVEWTYGDGTVSYASDGRWFHAWAYNDGAMCVSMGYLTPEQAIEATLGRGTCRNISPKLGNDEFTCEECLARVYGSGGQWFDVNWKYHKFNFCPNCGRRVEQ